MTTRPAPWAPGPLDAVRPDPGTRVLPYHRLGHADPEHRWWKPLVELLLFGAVYVPLNLVLAMVWGFWVVTTRGEDALDEMFLDLSAIDLMDPAILLMTVTALALMIPAALLARLVTGPRPVGLLLSVTGRLRWGFLGRTALLALAVYAVGHTVLLLLEYVSVGSLPPVQPVEGFWLIMLMVVLLVPLQSAAEELVFRGLLLQAVGRWLRHPLFAILLPVPLFTFGHIYDVLGLFGVAFLAVVFGYLTWRTGGLEAAIGLHVVNNVTAFSLEAMGLVDSDGEQSWFSLATVAVMASVYAWLVVRATRKHGVEVTRTVPSVPPRPTLPAPYPGGPGPLPLAPGAWVCPGPPACPGHWAGQVSGPVPERLP